MIEHDQPENPRHDVGLLLRGIPLPPPLSPPSVAMMPSTPARTPASKSPANAGESGCE
jgi:hypothetical protein